MPTTQTATSSAKADRLDANLSNVKSNRLLMQSDHHYHTMPKAIRFASDGALGKSFALNTYLTAHTDCGVLHI